MLCNKRKKLNIFMLLTAVAAVFGLPALAVSSVELHKLTASDAAAYDYFGDSVAINGSTALVGAYGNDDAGSMSGSAYLYDFSDPCNVVEIKLTASDAASGDRFGWWSVALSGSTALVGAPLDDDAGSDSGSAYLYDFSDPCNIIETKLTAFDATAGDGFGRSVALSGTTALVGAPLDDDAGSNSGSAYLYDFSDPCNVIEIKLTASDAASNDAFGHSVAISSTTALVGAYGNDDAGTETGSAYLYDFSDPSNIIETKLTASDIANGDYFGYSVAISGTIALVGAYGNDDAGWWSGSAYLYDFSDPSNIIETKLTASDGAANDYFGGSVAISGTIALVGARHDDDVGTDSGSAYFYDFGDPCNIIETKLTAPDAATNDNFGHSVAINGSTVLVGANYNDDAGSNSGSAYVTVELTNQPPVADAGPDQALLELGTTVTLDGDQSYDDEGDPITYWWTIIEMPAGSAAVLSNPTSAWPSFEADVYGDYIIELVVSDPWASSDPDSVTVSFDNIKPVADAGDNQAVIVGDTVNLDGSGSTDVNFDLLSFSWSFESVPAGSLAVLFDADTVNPSFTADVSGTYVVSLVANDGLLDSDADTVSIEAISSYDALVQIVFELIDRVNLLPEAGLKNRNLKNALTNKINDVLAMVDEGLYAEALDKLQKDILGKTDGCATNTQPDKNDWITTCPEQGQVYPLVMEAIELLEALI